MGIDRKIIIIIGDGMADEPLVELDGRTPLEIASTPNMDYIASHGLLGLARTVPEGIAPGSDTANLSIFGYNPRKYFTGRAPLEAINMNIPLSEKDAAFRCNFVTLEDGRMKDFTADHIDSAFSRIIVEELSAEIKEPGIEFHAGVSYRNIMVWRNYPYRVMPKTTPPHDISGREYDPYLPDGEGADMLRRLMELSEEIIGSSDRIDSAKKELHGSPVSAWLWGGGLKPAIEPMTTKYGLKGTTISAVDLIHGIGRVAGLVPCHVDGVTGYLDTNYSGKAAAALVRLNMGDNIVVVHVESPDESGHEGNIEHKVQSINDLDEKVVGPLLDGMNRFDDAVLLCMADHPTPITTRTHSASPVPFAIIGTKGFGSSHSVRKAHAYSEKEAAATGLFVDDASVLIHALVSGSLQ
jgi:2,3-bisphosphoglycerate-independent phosphoglycerate mutase